MKLRLTAHKYEEQHGSILTELFGVKARTEIEVANFQQAEFAIKGFGEENKPCNVWVSCKDARKPKGFDKWNNNACKFLFE